MLYFWITTAVHRAQRQESTPSRFGPRPKGRMRRKNHFSSESSLDKMATSSSTGSAVTTPSKASSPSPLVGSAVAYSRSSSGGSTTLPEKSLTSKRKASTTSLTLWLLINLNDWPTIFQKRHSVPSSIQALQVLFAIMVRVLMTGYARFLFFVPKTKAIRNLELIKIRLTKYVQLNSCK